jgi:hypothetical protein
VTRIIWGNFDRPHRQSLLSFSPESYRLLSAINNSVVISMHSPLVNTLTGVGQYWPKTRLAGCDKHKWSGNRQANAVAFHRFDDHKTSNFGERLLPSCTFPNSQGFRAALSSRACSLSALGLSPEDFENLIAFRSVQKQVEKEPAPFPI